MWTIRKVIDKTVMAWLLLQFFVVWKQKLFRDFDKKRNVYSVYFVEQKMWLKI